MWNNYLSMYIQVYMVIWVYMIIEILQKIPIYTFIWVYIMMVIDHHSLHVYWNLKIFHPTRLFGSIESYEFQKYVPKLQMEGT